MSTFGLPLFLLCFAQLAMPSAQAAATTDDQIISALSEKWFATQVQGKVAQAAVVPVEKYHNALVLGDYLQAVQLWPQVQGRIPAGKRPADEASFLYSLLKLRLGQTFVDQWLKSMRDPVFTASAARKTLDEYLASGFDRWLMIESIELSKEQETELNLAAVKASPIHLSLLAWVGLKKPAQVGDVLHFLPANHALKLPLAKAVAFDRFRKGKTDQAIAILSQAATVAEESKANAADLGAYYLQLGRLSFEKQDFANARLYYGKVSRESPDFLIAREELTWVLLQQQDNSSLRGQLASLTSGVADGRLTPEAHLVRAISNMKLCHFSSVEQDINHFIALNGPWAKQVDLAFKEKQVPEPRTLDFYSRLASISVLRRKAELDTLQTLQAGKNPYWTAATSRMTALLAHAVQARKTEYLRQWRNDRVSIEEAVRKMRFVKAEWMNDMRIATAVSAGAKKGGGDEIQVTAAAAVREEPGEIQFPYDGVIWTDELFKLRSAAENRCRSEAEAQRKDSNL